MASDKYNKAITNTIRQTKAEIIFDLIDVTANTDCTPIFPNQAIFSKGNQILDDNIEKDVKIATLEPRFWKLDGSFKYYDEDISNNEIGLVTDVISNENGEFETNPILSLEFSTEHSSIGLTLYFDNITNNYAEKMRIRFYNADTLLSDEAVENNDIKFIYDKKVEKYNKIEIEFTKTSLPYRRIRLLNIFFGIIQIYNDKDIIKCNLIREINLLNDNIPSHELSFEIDNLAKKFNLINPQGIYNYLQKRQMANIKLGVVLEDNTTEYIDMGRYYLNSWETKGLVASLKATDLLTILDENTYKNETNQTKSLKEFAIEILNHVGITEYILDDSLDNIQVTTIISENSIKELLKQIAIASNCIVYTDKNNIINITKIKTENVNKEINFDNIYNVPDITLDELVSKIKVTYYSGEENYTVTINNTENEGKEISIDSIFITSESQAIEVANYLLDLYNNRLLYSIKWRQDMEIDINNKVLVEDDFKENKSIVVTKQEFNYQGYLNGNTDGRGII